MARDGEGRPIGAASLFSRAATEGEIRMLLERALSAPDVDLPTEVREELRGRLAGNEPPGMIAEWLTSRMGWAPDR